MEVPAAAPPPPGQVSNFIDPPTRAPQAIAVVSFLIALCTVVVFLRMYSKFRVTKMMGWDDVMTALAFITDVISTGYSLAALKDGGLGPHIWDIPVTDFNAAYTNRLLVDQISFPIVSFFAKASVIFLLLRIFPKSTNRYAYILCYLGLATILVFNVITLVLISYYCVPRPSDHGFNPPTCITKGLTTSEASAGFNMIIDLYLLAIPVPIVMGLNMSFRRKIAVVAVFTTGMLACLCSVLNLYYRVNQKHTTDPSWAEIPAIIVSNAEFDISIITACLPCFPALSTHLRENGFYSLRGLISRVSFSRTSHGSRGTRRDEGLVELYDVDERSGKSLTKKSGSLSEVHAGEIQHDV